MLCNILLSWYNNFLIPIGSRNVRSDRTIPCDSSSVIKITSCRPRLRSRGTRIKVAHVLIDKLSTQTFAFMHNMKRSGLKISVSLS